MRPVYLEMTAFGSYKHCELDFEKLGREGLYLITGKTGSGKTTIFDAITYALYGELSGDERKKKMMISQYAEKGCNTSVKLIFELDGKKYMVTRTGGKEKDSLIYPGGRKPVDNKVTDEIVKLLGMTRGQFKQIMMLAQGDFRELLTAKASERKEIFRKIFGTELDDKFQELLKRKTNELFGKLTSERDKALDTVKSVRCGEESEIGEKKSLIIGNELANIDTLNEFAELLITLIADESKTLDQLGNEKIILENMNTELIKQIENGKKRDEFLAIINNLEQELPELKESAERLLKSAERIKSENDPRVKKINEEDVPHLKESLADYEKRDKLRVEKDKLISRIFKNQTEAAEKTKKREEISTLLLNYKNELETLGNIDVNIANLDSQLKDLVSRKKLLSSLREAAEKLAQDRVNRGIAVKEYKNAEKNWEEQQEKSDEMFKLFWDDQAGIIASEKLTEGKPCPVCGSVHHPKIAIKSENAPTKADVDKAKAQTDHTQNAFIKAGEKCAKFESIVKNSENSVKEKIDDLSLDCMVDEAAVFAEKEFEKVNAELEILTAQREEEIKIFERRKRLTGEIPEAERQIEELSQCANKLKEKIAADNSALEGVEKRLAELSELEFETKAEAEKKINLLKRNSEAMEQQIKDIQNAADSERKKLNDVLVSIKAYSDTVEEMPRYDAAALTAKQSALTEEKNALNEKLDDLKVSMNVNSEALEKVSDEYKKLRFLEREYRDYMVLSKTANNEAGSRIDFESYVQSVYFEKVLFHANAHFRAMSSGQFELIRKKLGDGRSNFALDMDIMDSYTGSSRDVNSLSGGEKFIASLALALGLSETVQEYSGGIRLETMFIDEGFGSLDDEKLDDAMRVLNSLADGRIIGIISHVEAVKNEIARKIVVIKDEKKGSTAKIEI